jgi:rare lipoprotein A
MVRAIMPNVPQGRSVAFLICLVGLSACAAPQKSHFYSPYEGKLDRAYKLVGIASWYGHPFHGRRTASGERYDMNKLTCAHKTLPFGAMLKVTNLSNQKSVIVKVNDRGPFIRGREIDLSREAAKQLAFKGAGITRVEIEWIDDPANHPNMAEEKQTELAQQEQGNPPIVAQNEPALAQESDTIADLIDAVEPHATAPSPIP